MRITRCLRTNLFGDCCSLGHQREDRQHAHLQHAAQDRHGEPSGPLPVCHPPGQRPHNTKRPTLSRPWCSRQFATWQSAAALQSCVSSCEQSESVVDSSRPFPGLRRQFSTHPPSARAPCDTRTGRCQAGYRMLASLTFGDPGRGTGSSPGEAVAADQLRADPLQRTRLGVHGLLPLDQRPSRVRLGKCRG